jgi:pyruvate dehydrogenase E1 component alpha subunit
VQSPLAPRQSPHRVVWKWAASYGMHSVPVDGTNVLAVHETAREAVKRAREGSGPTFIEAQVYRFRAHGGAGDDSKTGYRQIAEREAWEKVDPVESLYPLLQGFDRATMEADIQKEILAAFEHALSSADPTEADLYRHVYAVG